MVATTSDVVGCEGCGTRAVGHGRRRLKVRDLPMADRAVGAGVGQAPVALTGSGLRGGQAVRGGRRYRAAGGVDRPADGEHLPGSRCVAGDDEPADRRLARLVRVRGGHRCVRSQPGAVGWAVVGVASEAPRPARACLDGTAPRSWPPGARAADGCPTRSSRTRWPSSSPLGSHRDRAIALLMLLDGLRAGEVRLLRLADVDAGHGECA